MRLTAPRAGFGSLCIQRQRWANGGLLILPKLRQQSRARPCPRRPDPLRELFLRWNYYGVHLLELLQPAHACSRWRVHGPR